METIKVIDLLNEIAQGEKVPKKIKFRDKILTYIDGSYEDKNGKELLDGYWECRAVLNDEVEIIEKTKKIGKIPLIRHKNDCKTVDCDALQYKIDELIDAVNELKKEEK